MRRAETKMTSLSNFSGGHPALSDVTPCLLSDFFENSGGTPTPPPPPPP